jgi:N-acetylneuraminate synthase
VALGACVIEKHFTLSREDKGPDSEFSIEPDELQTLCQNTLAAWSALGHSGFDRQKSEEASRQYRRSVYFVKDMKAGQKITASDIKRIRPGYGLAPKYFDDLLGRTVRKDILRGTATHWALIND